MCYSPGLFLGSRLSMFQYNANEDKILDQLEALKKEHRTLDDLIDGCSMKDQLQVQRLKREKLVLKDKISKLEAMLHPDIIA